MRPDVVDSRRTNGAILVSTPITDRSSRQPPLACVGSEFAFGSFAREISFQIVTRSCSFNAPTCPLCRPSSRDCTLLVSDR